MMGEVGQLFVGEEGVVPVHRAVGVGDGEGEVVFVDSLAREVLEHDVDVVGVLNEGDGVDKGTFVVGEGLRFEAAVVEAVDIVADCGAAVGLACAAEGRGEVGVVGGVGGDGEVVACAFAAPCYELILAGGDVEVHQVAFGAEGFAALAFLPDDGAGGGVDEVEGDGLYLLGEGVGIEHVVVKDEAGFVVRVAVSFIFIDELVAGAECDGCYDER